MPSFFSELQRRKVFRVSIAYIITAWVLAQVAELMLESFSAPGWVVKAILVFLIIGFPMAAILAWAYEMTPDGIKLDSDVYPTPPERVDPPPFPAHPEREDAHSIAILPFTDMSEDGGHEYFSDGLAEELLNLLTRIPELRVASRTSAFSFKNKHIDIKKVARKLKVAYILEGSVRKSGNRVRITTQLIKASDGFHVWSDSYDRPMDNIFAVQDEIALAVVEVLRLKLLDEAPRASVTDPRAYSLFLQGRHYRLQRSRKSLASAVKAYRESLEIAPDYAPALAGLSQAYLFEAAQSYRDWEEGVALARKTVEQALALDPNQALAWVSLSRIKSGHDWDWAGAQADLERARKLEPGNTEVLYTLSELYASKGLLEEAVALCRKVLELDPLQLNAYHDQGRFLIEQNRLDEAEKCYSLLLDLNPAHHNAHGYLAKIMAVKGDFEGALAEIEKLDEPFWKAWATLLVHYIARSTADMTEQLEQFISENQHDSAFQIAQLYATNSDVNNAFKWLEQAYVQRDSGLAQSLLSDGILRVLYGDPRWELLIARIGLLQAYKAMPKPPLVVAATA